MSITRGVIASINAEAKMYWPKVLVAERSISILQPQSEADWAITRDQSRITGVLHESQIRSVFIVT